jgi:hypothetical protein
VRPHDDENEVKTPETAEAHQTEQQIDDDLFDTIAENIPEEMKKFLAKLIVDSVPDEDKQVFTAPEKANEVYDLCQDMLDMILTAKSVEKKRMLANLAHNTMNHVIAYLKGGISDMKRLSGEEGKPRA